MIAFHIYGSVDLAVFCVVELRERGHAPADAVEQLNAVVLFNSGHCGTF
ncbi:MAG TPA: hypothetical protein VGG53_01765 [Mycobacterium sp.]|jgi:hypothetical protein